MKPSPPTPPVAKPPLDRKATLLLPPEIAAGIASLSAHDSRVTRLEAAIREVRGHLLAAEALLAEALRG